MSIHPIYSQFDAGKTWATGVDYPGKHPGQHDTFGISTKDHVNKIVVYGSAALRDKIADFLNKECAEGDVT